MRQRELKALQEKYDKFSIGYGEIIQVILNVLRTHLFGSNGLLETRSIKKRTKPLTKRKKALKRVLPLL